MLEQRTSGRASLANRLLAALPEREWKRLRPVLEELHAEQRQEVHVPGHTVEHAYFPTGAVFSLLLPVEGGTEVEVGTVGREGLVGLTALLGEEPTPVRTICQVPGPALRLPADALRAEGMRLTTLASLAQRYSLARLRQTQRLVACNLLHTAEQRLCRWLLKLHDDVGDDTVPLTQQLLALMLGVQRPTVTVVAGELQRAGLILVGRGRVIIRDRRGLEAACCSCYRAMRDEIDQLLAPRN